DLSLQAAYQTDRTETTTAAADESEAIRPRDRTLVTGTRVDELQCPWPSVKGRDDVRNHALEGRSSERVEEVGDGHVVGNLERRGIDRDEGHVLAAQPVPVELNVLSRYLVQALGDLHPDDTREWVAGRLENDSPFPGAEVNEDVGRPDIALP